MTNILQEYEQNMTRIRQECDRCFLPYEDAGPRGSAWPSELGSVTPNSQEMLNFLSLVKAFSILLTTKAYEKGPSVLRYLYTCSIYMK